jgi:hypothetical protein
VASSLVGAHSTTSSSTATYYFDSLVNTSPSGGVPGLIEYCVIYSGSDPTNVTSLTAFGANTGSGEFSFSRPDGNPSNIPLDGTTTQMGTATWSGSVPSPTFLLHINDSAECEKLYHGTDQTCWVLPGSSTEPTPTATSTPAGQPTPTSTPGQDPTATPTIPAPQPTPTGTLPPGK